MRGVAIGKSYSNPSSMLVWHDVHGCLLLKSVQYAHTMDYKFVQTKTHGLDDQQIKTMTTEKSSCWKETSS